MNRCLCGSGKGYGECCQPFHKGKEPKSAVELMRSRYSAYALGLGEYIIKTTHPASPHYQMDQGEWVEELREFSKETHFEGVEILDVREGEETAVVTFVAKMREKTFTERSYFEKVKGRWLYRRGKLQEGRAPNLITVDQERLLPVAYYGDPILRKKGKLIEEVNEDLRKLVQGMIETMDAYDGMGLAAPQVHHSLRLFIVRMPVPRLDGKYEAGEVEVFLNPVLSDPGKEQVAISEGCVSIPSIRGRVERPREITIEYTNLEGKRLKYRCKGWLARIIQHEADHIDGILYIDRMSQEERKEIEPFLKHLHHRIHDGTEM